MTARIHLEPFTLHECEEYYRVSGPALRAKVQAFLDETHTRKAPQLTVITPYGLKSNAYSGNVQAQVTADALFG